MKSSIDRPSLKGAVGTLAASIDVAKIYADQLAKVEGILHANNYDEAIRVYANKGLLSQLSRVCFGMSRDGFIAFVKSFFHRHFGSAPRTTASY